MLLAILIGLFVMGLLAAILFKRFVKPDVGDALLASLVFAPAFLYWIQAQPLAELTGFRLSAKFNSEAKTAVTAIASDFKNLIIHSSSADDPVALASSEGCVEYIVARPSRVPEYGSALDSYTVITSRAIKNSIACGRMLGIVVLDDSDKYIGSYDKEFFSETLSLWAADAGPESIASSDLALKIRTTTMFGASLRYPDERIKPGEGFVAAINEDATIEHAFRKFENTGANFLVVTDATGKFRGIITFRSVVQFLLGALLEGNGDETT